MRDLIERQAAIDAIENEQMKIMRSDWAIDQAKFSAMSEIRALIADLPSVSMEKTGRCKNCKWWKDSDGIYRRGGHAESQCPINRREVLEGNGYCYMFEPQPYKAESEG